jgi:hypothetical protein
MPRHSTGGFAQIVLGEGRPPGSQSENPADKE